MTEQELREKIYDLRREQDKALEEAKEYALVRGGIGYAAFGVLMFFHLDGWLESHHVIGISQWLYIIPFFLVMGLLGLWLAHEGIRLKNILKRQK